MELLRHTRLLAVILPELVSLAETPVERDRPESENLWQRTLAVLDRLPSPGFPLALAALLHASAWQEQATSSGNGARAAAEIVRQVGERWRLSNKEKDGATWLVEHHRALVSAESIPWPRLQRLLISPDIDDLLKLHAAIASASGHEPTHVDFCRRCLQIPPEELNPAPVLTGDDLVRHGVPRGKHYQTLLEAVRDAQLEKRVTNLDEALGLVDRLLEGA